MSDEVRRFLLHLLSPPFAPPRTVIFCRFLRAWRKQKIPISLGNQDFTVFCFSSKWCHQESNRGHKDFQSFALPTELWHHCFCFASAKVIGNFLFCKFLYHFFTKKGFLFCLYHSKKAYKKKSSYINLLYFNKINQMSDSTQRIPTLCL